MARRIKVKIPKRVAGVKIPKQLRKGGLNSFLNSSGGQMVIAEALMLLAGALAVGKTDPHTPAGDALRHPVRAGKRALDAAGMSGRRTRDVLGDSSSRLSYAFTRAVAAFRDAMHEDHAGSRMSATGRSLRNEDDLDMPPSGEVGPTEGDAVVAADEVRGKKKRAGSQAAASGQTATSSETSSSIPH